MILYCPRCKEYMGWAGSARPGQEPNHEECGGKLEAAKEMPEPEVEVCPRCGRTFNYYGGIQLCRRCRREWTGPSVSGEEVKWRLVTSTREYLKGEMMKQKLIGLGVTLGGLFLVLGIYLASKGKGQAQAEPPAQEQKVPAEKSRISLPPGENSGKKDRAQVQAQDLDLTGLESKEDLEEKQVKFTQIRVIRDRATNRVKGLSLTDEKGTGYVFWNEAPEGEEGFKNPVLPRGFKMNTSYKIRGKQDKPYRGNLQFQVKEFVQ